VASIRNKADGDALLDAARDCVLAVGLRRTTLTDVARRAGVSRMTIYRRWPDMTSLVADLMTREWGELTADATAAAGAGDGPTRPRFVAAVVTAARALRRHPVFRRIVELDPEILLPYLTLRRGTSQDRMLAMMTAAIGAGIADGSVRAGEPALLARGVLLATQGFVLSMPTVTDGVTEDELDAQLLVLLDRFLAP
jgi:AcrR family transcriptional regulator